MHAVVTEGLSKRYGETAALDRVDLAIPEGKVWGLLGPNGAGKTTLVRILATLVRPDSGTARVAGYDVGRESGAVRERIGLVGQHAALDELLTGRQNLVMFGRLFHLGMARARTRAVELLEQFGLTEAADKTVGQYSGGMRRRLDLAASLILTPSVLFLDEPTTGLDPRGRAEVWAAVRSLVVDGTSVLLTTQYLDEADQLADHIEVLDSGRVIASGPPEALKTARGGDRLDLVLHDADQLAAGAALLERITGAEVTIDPDERRLSAPVADRMAALTETVHALTAAGVSPEDIVLRRPTLDEVFLYLTDKEMAA